MPAQGHVIPAVDTALLLATHGAVCTIVATPSMAIRVRPTIESAQQSGLQVRLADFPLKYTKVDMRTMADSEDGVQTLQIRNNYFQAMAQLREPIESYLRKHAPFPTCVVSDFCQPWTTELAANLGVPRLSFYSMCAFCLLCQHNVERFNAYGGVADDNEPVVVPGVEKKFMVTRAQARGFFRGIHTPCWEEFARYVERARAEADGVIVNTFLQMEPEYVAGYAAAWKMNVWTIGPVSLYHQQGVATLATRGNNTAIDADECLGWLDGKEPRNVVYVSFGNSMAVEVLGIGVSVGVKEPLMYQAVKTDIVVGRDVVEKTVRSVMDGGEEGDKRRCRARALADKARAAVQEGGPSHANLLDLIKRFGMRDAHGKAQ